MQVIRHNDKRQRSRMAGLILTSHGIYDHTTDEQIGKIRFAAGG
jgi:hypothetical protein